MTGLKTIVLSYSGTDMTESSYNGLSTSAKLEYRNFLTSTLTGIQYANFIWKLSYEIYIPSGVVLAIPKGVTLLADGGLFSGRGTLAGNYTKIKAGFEQIFSTEVNFKRNNGDGTMYQWDVKESHPEWFGETVVNKTAEDNGNTNFENLTGNCSLRIQKAIDLIHASTDGYTIGGVKQQLFAGGKVVCKPYSLYNIQTTIYLPLGISFDGGNSNFVYDCTSGSYMFKVNMKEKEDMWAVGSRGQMDVITNIRMINPKRIKDAFGFYSGSQCCTFENIQSFNLCQTFKRFSEYIDALTLRDINVAAGMKSSDDRYQIDISYIGDNLLIDNASFTFEGDTVKGISVNACGGGLIQRITNGTIEIKNSKAMILSAVHQESGNTIIANSQIEVSGLCHFKQPGVPAFIINTREKSYEIRPITIKNSSILYNRRMHVFNDNELDVKLGHITGPIKIENVVRMFQGPWTESSSAYAININNNAFLKNPAANSISSTLVGSIVGGTEEGLGYLHNNFISYQIGYYGSILSSVSPTMDPREGEKDYNERLFDSKQKFPLGTYTYWASIILDKDRNLGFNCENHKLSYKIDDPTIIYVDGEKKSITTSYIAIDLYRSYYLGLTIRLFKLRQDDASLYYIDLPVCTSNNTFYDLGATNMFGEMWNKIKDDAEKAKVTPLECYDYRLMGNNVSVRMPSRPNTSGAGWRKGDTIVLNSGEIINV